MVNPLLTESEFTLPRGLIDASGTVHRQGTMRLATAKDEILARRDRKVQQYPEYLTLVMLSRVITHLGTLAPVTPIHLENLFTQDLAYLREIYNHLNQEGHTAVAAHCPRCNADFTLDLALAGESLATP